MCLLPYLNPPLSGKLALPAYLNHKGTKMPSPDSPPRLIVELAPGGEYLLEYYINGQRCRWAVPAGTALDFAIRDALAEIKSNQTARAKARAEYFATLAAQEREKAKAEAEAKAELAAQERKARRNLHAEIYNRALADGHNGAWVDRYIEPPAKAKAKTYIHPELRKKAPAKAEAEAKPAAKTADFYINLL